MASYPPPMAGGPPGPEATDLGKRRRTDDPGADPYAASYYQQPPAGQPPAGQPGYPPQYAQYPPQVRRVEGG